MILQLLVTTAVVVFISSSSALITSSTPYCQGTIREAYSQLRPKKEFYALSMSPSEARLRLRTVMKQTKSRKPHNMPGYIRGNFDLIRVVFSTHSVGGEMTYTAFLDSKYLRFWPGRRIDIEEIWIYVTSDRLSSAVNFQQLPLLLSKLDDVADLTELAMEQERLAWELEDIKHNFLDGNFESITRGRRPPFVDFIT